MEVKAYSISTEIRIRNMVCSCCVRLAKQELENAGVAVEYITIGRAKVSFHSNAISLEDIDALLKGLGLGIIHNREEQIVDKIKQTVIELIHQMNNVDSIVRKSEYLTEKLGMNYQTMSKIFSQHENITLEKFIILNKIERIKELIDSNEYTLSEIAYMMDYSSVQYLSGQFKKITGLSVSEYKNSEFKDRKPLDELY